MIIKKTGVFARIAALEKRNEMEAEKEYNDIVVVSVVSSFKMLIRVAEYNKHSCRNISGDDKPHPNLPQHTIKADDGYENKLRKQNHLLTHVRPNQHPLLPI